MSITIQYDSGETILLPSSPHFLMGDLYTVVYDHYVKQEGGDVNGERIMFYNQDYRRVPYHSDRQPVLSLGTFFRIFFINENLIAFFFQGPREKTEMWPWTMDNDSHAWLQAYEQRRAQRQP